MQFARLASWIIWLRGAFAAFALLGLLTEIFELTRLEGARALHAIVINWNVAVGSFVFYVVNLIPWVPDIDLERARTIGNSLLLVGLTTLRQNAEVEQRQVGTRGRVVLMARWIFRASMVAVGCVFAEFC